MEVKVKDEPFRCFQDLDEEQKMGVMTELLVRDFREGDKLSLQEEESVCHQILQNSHGYAFFTHRCCNTGRDGVTIECMINQKNVWLRIIDILLIVAKFVVLFFGPLMAPAAFFNKALDSVRFVIKLKDPVLKTICIVRGMDKIKVNAKHTIDLCDEKHFSKCKDMVSRLPYDAVIPIRIRRFEIAVDYSKLLVENKVPVGLIRSIANAVFSCGLRDIAPFKECCQMNMFSYLKDIQPVPWIIFWSGIGKLLLVLLVPSLFYVRLLSFYSFENPEIAYRTHIAQQNNISLSPHEFKMMQYLLPTHPMCITIYCIYCITVIILAYVGLTGDMKRFQRIIYTSFADLKSLSWLKASELFCAKVIWPFSKFGVIGCLIAPVYWIFVVPFIFIIYLVYCTPLLFLTYRMIGYSIRVLHKAKLKRDALLRRPYIPSPLDRGIRKGAKKLEGELLFHELLPKRDGAPIDRDKPANTSMRRVSIRCLAVFLLILSVYGMSILATECAGFVAEVLTFTLMGIIVNASSVLKYMTLILLVVMYSYDCYNNVYKKYVKLNKALFGDVKGRMTKQVEEVTSLPAHLQENTGFKACENSEQADYESPDEISSTLPMHWDLNDVIMFIDNEDMPRIPRTLFEQVCQIRVAGSPGPVYRSMIEATKKFMFIILFLIFVFIVVLSFGSVYKVSSTNQTLATLAGGFVPFIMRNFMQPATPELEIGTVSFRSKLDEIIQNFQQQWPMYDFPFEVNTGEEIDKDNPETTCDKSTQTTNTSSEGTQTDPGFSITSEQGSNISRTLLSPDNNCSSSNALETSSLGRDSIHSQTPDIMSSAGLILTEDTSPSLPNGGHTLSYPIYQTDSSPIGPTTKIPKGILKKEKCFQPLPHSLSVNSDSSDACKPSDHHSFEMACGQDVDLVILLPESGESTWCRVWSNISLYNPEEMPQEEEEPVPNVEEV